MRRWWLGRRASLGIATGLLFVGCAGSGGGGGPAKPTCKPPATPTVCFTNNIQPIFNRSCAVSGCHNGSSAAQNLDLSPGQSYHAIVGVSAQQQPKLKLIPSNGIPDASYLLQKVLGASTISGTPMPPPGCPAAPQNGATCPSDADKQAIAQWITECAQNNTCP